MKRLSALLFTVSVLLGFSLPAQALLIDQGGGLIYDNVLDITWLQDANYAQTSGYDTDGMMTWAQAVTWADTLSYYDSVRDYTYTDWRLPQTLPVNGTSYEYNNYIFSYDGSTDVGYNVSAPGSVYPGSTGSEMAYMYYINLGNLGYYDTSGSSPQPGWGLNNTGPFTNLLPYAYWSDTEDAATPDYAWFFRFVYGYQTAFYKTSTYPYTWAVRPGNVIPEPGTLLLLATGLAGLVAGRKKR